MIYGKISKYGPSTNKLWYDFPGINIPYLHGIYFPDEAEYQVFFMNNNIKKKTYSIKIHYLLISQQIL